MSPEKMQHFLNGFIETTLHTAVLLTIALSVLKPEAHCHLLSCLLQKRLACNSMSVSATMLVLLGAEMPLDELEV